MSDPTVDDMAASPIGFAELILGVKLYAWQDEVLSWFENTKQRVKGALRTPNGAGKSSTIVAPLALWTAAAHEQGTCVITSASARQINEQVWPSIVRHREKFPDWTWKSNDVTTPSGGRIRLFVTDEAGRAEGWHKLDDVQGPLVMIADEAKSVREPIFEAFDRCTWNGLLYVSSPGARAGRFYDAFTKQRAQFFTRAVGLKECPHIPAEKVADIIARYGEDHPFTRSSVFGEFMDDEAIQEYVCNLTALERCLMNPPTHEPSHELIGFCDFGKGSAENVLAVRNGNKIERLDCWREADEMAAVGQFIMKFRKYGLQPQNVWGDSGGDIGKKVCDLLAEAGWGIGRVNFGQPAKDALVYLSWSSEAWHETAKLIDQCAIILPDDETLKAQLTTRKHKLNNRGKLELESKAELLKRGIVSPDRADAVAGAFSMQSLTPLAGKHIVQSWREQMAQLDEGHQGTLAGMNAGD